MSDHYTLDVDPEGLRSTAKKLGQLQEHLSSKGQKASATPGDVGDQWQGAAATSIKAEMTGLGQVMTGYSGKFHTSAAALTSLAKDYEHAEDEVARLNTRWAKLDAAYDAAVTQAKNDYDRTMKDAGNDPSTGKVNPQARKMIQHEAGESQGYATSAAYSTREKGRGDLDTEFGMLKQWLASQTRGAASALADAGPSQVDNRQIDDWKNGVYPHFGHPELSTSMALTAQKVQAEIDAEEKAKYDAAKGHVDKDLDALEKVLDDPYADPDEVKDLLARIGQHKTDTYYAMAMVDPGNAERMNKLFDSITWQCGFTPELADTVKPGIDAVMDLMAIGLHAQTSANVASFGHRFVSYSQGEKRLALIADSDFADGRVKALAITYYARIKEQGRMHSPSGGIDPFDQYYQDAYGTDSPLPRWDAASSGKDLEDLLDAASPDVVRDMVADLVQPFQDGTNAMSYDDYKLKAKVYGEALDEAIRREDEVAVEAMLKEVDRPSIVYAQGNPLAGYVNEHLKDPKTLAFLVQAARRGEIDGDTITEAYKNAGADIDMDDLVKKMVAYEAGNRDFGERRLADDIGYLLGTSDLLGQKVEFDGVVKSLLGSIVGAASENPVPGAAFGVLTALYDEMAKMEENEEKWADSWDETTQHDMLTFLIYTKLNGNPPGYDGWLAQQPAGVQKDPSDAVTDYMKHLENAKNDTAEQRLSERMQEIEDWIYTARHHSG